MSSSNSPPPSHALNEAELRSTGPRHVNEPAEIQSLLPSTSKKLVVVGIYGISGCGKSYLLGKLKEELDANLFNFYEGSEAIHSVTPGGLKAFQEFEKQEKAHWRQRAVDSIAKNCATTGRVGVIAGHFMFWDENKSEGYTVYTHNDLEIYTHIIYLNIDPEIISKRRLADVGRSRPWLSVETLREWQRLESTELKKVCRDNNILLAKVSSEKGLIHTVSTLLHDFRCHTEELNLSRATEMADRILAADDRQLHTMLVVDGDRTLIPEDSGNLFWKMASRYYPNEIDGALLKDLFGSKLGYSYTAFRQAALLHEETFGEEDFNLLCEEVASTVTLRPEFVSLFREAGKRRHVGVVVMTCGLRRIWNFIIEKAGLSGIVKVIAGGLIADGFVVTPEVKASLVSRLRQTHKLFVWAFGDSPLDLQMLAQADEAIVVVGEDNLRSKTMDVALPKAIGSGGLQARQVLLPSNVSPRLDSTRLPILDLFNPDFVESVILKPPRDLRPKLHISHATEKNSAKLLMTPMRDAVIAGPGLREAHRKVGWYLATEFLSEFIGVAQCPIEHVQGHVTNGYRLLEERGTLIVPLMRGGEPMAFGISEAFPLARFLHAIRPDDVKFHHLQGIRNVILVDSVINSGGTIVEFARYLRQLRPTARVLVVAGVVQGRSVSPGGLVYGYASEEGLEIVALRISDNSFTGSRGTDTGNRLFNTTHLV